MFDALKKSANGFEMLTSMMEERARENGGSFDQGSDVLPATAGIYLTQADPDRTDYRKRGELGVDKLINGVKSFDTVRDKRIYYQYGRDRARGRGSSDRFNFEPMRCYSKSESFDIQPADGQPKDYGS